MANSIYLTLKGMKQGLISAGCSSFESLGNKYQSAHQDQIFVYSFNHSLMREQNANHLPAEFIKPMDKSSPLLGLALSENEELYLLFDFYRTASEGLQQKFYSIELRGASLKQVSVNYPHSLTHADSQPEELVVVAYKDIRWTHHIAGTDAYSFWSDRVF
ncbi:Hcp family type VI secretion system effector [Saezia sanguinis]|uniref:Hcp family type VI secretion system effector n=1 Tax=Saezia sanguinis TaxID=1965230 RepID=UPI0030388E1C